MWTIIGTIIFWIFVISFIVGCIRMVLQSTKNVKSKIQQKIYYGQILEELRQQRPR